jgi:hypothetical protein
VKVALDEFKGIVTLAGTARPGTLELNPTTTALLVAAALRLAVQVLVPPDDRELGAHTTEVRVTAVEMRMFPPVADMGMTFPAREAPIVPLTPMDIEVAFGASATVTTATLPFGIVFVLSPVVKHVYALALPAQVMLLAEDVSAESAVTEKLVTLAEG